jgi:cytochrome b6-f complex iron-sulfur subunit
MNELNRREFLATEATAATLCACATCPEALAAATAAGPADAGALTDYAKDGLFDKLAKDKQIVLMRKDGKLYAATALCTHQQGVIATQDDHFRCPKHNSLFDIEGKVTKGPAKNPLTRYAIKLDEKGHVVVDTAKKLTEAQWGDAGSFLKV